MHRVSRPETLHGIDWVPWLPWRGACTRSTAPSDERGAHETRRCGGRSLSLLVGVCSEARIEGKVGQPPNANAQRPIQCRTAAARPTWLVFWGQQTIEFPIERRFLLAMWQWFGRLRKYP